MNDEQQLRALLRVAAEPPGELEPPVLPLLMRARRRRNLRVALSVAAAAIVIVLAFGAVAVEALTHLSGPSSGPGPVVGGIPLFGNVPPPAEAGPTAGQIARFRWSTLPPTAIGIHTSPTVVWADRELFQISYGVGSTPGAAAVYRPAVGRWFKIASPPQPGANQESSAAAAWTGSELFVADGRSECGATKCATYVDLYHPATNRWTSTPEPKPMTLLAPQAAVWTGQYVILTAISPQGGGDLTVAAYAPASGRWQMITPRLPRDHQIQEVAMVATADRVILWSMWSLPKRAKHAQARRFGVDVLASSYAGSWYDVTGGWPQNDYVISPVFTDRGILSSPGPVWCGGGSCAGVFPGSFANQDSLKLVGIPPGPLGQAELFYTWTGRTIIAFNPDAITSGPGSSNIGPDETELYDPASKTWHSLPAPPSRPSIAAVPAWTGSELLILTSSGRLLALGR